MTDKMQTLNSLLEQDQAGLEWTKSQFSGGGAGDCLEVAKVEGKGYLLRHSILNDHVIPLTDSEYEAYVKGVKAGQPGLTPGL